MAELNSSELILASLSVYVGLLYCLLVQVHST